YPNLLPFRSRIREMNYLRFTPNDCRAVLTILQQGYFRSHADDHCQRCARSGRSLLELRLSRGHVFIKQFKDWKNRLTALPLQREIYVLASNWRKSLDRSDPVIPFFRSGLDESKINKTLAVR